MMSGRLAESSLGSVWSLTLSLPLVGSLEEDQVSLEAS